jgi:hypothetical protein
MRANGIVSETTVEQLMTELEKQQLRSDCTNRIVSLGVLKGGV